MTRNLRLFGAMLPLLLLTIPAFAQETTYRCGAEAYHAGEGEPFTVEVVRSGALVAEQGHLVILVDGVWVEDTSVNVEFAEGQTSASHTYTLQNDYYTGDPEDLVVRCGGSSGSPGTASLSLADDEPFPTLSVPSELTYGEADWWATVPLKFTPPIRGYPPITARVIGGTATEGVDYQIDPTVDTYLNYRNGGTSSHRLDIEDDLEFEPDETFTIEYEGSGFHARTTVTIAESDVPPPRFGASTYAFAEPVATGVISIEKTPSTRPESYTLRSVPRIGLWGSPSTTSVYFAAGQSVANVTIPIDDALYTGTRELTLELLKDRTFVTSTLVTATDDETPPSISIDDVAVLEGPAGASRSATFTVSLTGALGINALVNLSGKALTATQYADFGAVRSSINIPSGSLSASFNVPITGDDAVEPDETFEVTITSCCNGLIPIVKPAGTCTILNDDGVTGPSFDFASADSGVPEHDGLLPFSVRRLKDRSGSDDVTVRAVPVSPAMQPAIEPANVHFSAGAATQDGSLAIGDALYSGNRTVRLEIVSGGKVEASVTAEIVEDESVPVLTLRNTSVRESLDGSEASFNLSIEPAYAIPINVDARTEPGTAASGSDFRKVSRRIVVPAGSRSATFDVEILDDALVESDERFSLVLQAQVPNSATPVTLTAIGTILDDDGTERTLLPDGEWVMAGSSLKLTIDAGEIVGSAQSIRLASSSPSTASVPASVRISAGQRTVSFDVAAHARGDATISATLESGLVLTASVHVFQWHVPVSTPAVVIARQGSEATFEIALEPPSPIDVPLTLHSQDEGIMTVDTQAVVPAGGRVTIRVHGIRPGATLLDVAVPPDHGGMHAYLPAEVGDGMSKRRGVRH